MDQDLKFRKFVLPHGSGVDERLLCFMGCLGLEGIFFFATIIFVLGTLAWMMLNNRTLVVRRALQHPLCSRGDEQALLGSGVGPTFVGQTAFRSLELH